MNYPARQAHSERLRRVIQRSIPAWLFEPLTVFQQSSDRKIGRVSLVRPHSLDTVLVDSATLGAPLGAGLDDIVLLSSVVAVSFLTRTMSEVAGSKFLRLRVENRYKN